MNLIGTGEIIDDETWGFVREELKTGWQAQAALVAGRQARIAQANDRLEHAWIEGLGQHVASIDSFAYADWERRNPGITGDKDWLHGLLRDNPECRVKSRSPKTQVSFAGLDFNPSENTGICPPSSPLKSEISNLKCGEGAAATVGRDVPARRSDPVGTAGPSRPQPSTRHSSPVTRHSSLS